MDSSKTVSESKAEMVEVMLPNDANPLGNVLGGKVLHLVDLAAAIAAHRHSRSYVATAGMDHVDFLNPVHIGELLVLKSSVNRWRRRRASFCPSATPMTANAARPRRLPPRARRRPTSSVSCATWAMPGAVARISTACIPRTPTGSLSRRTPAGGW